MEKKGAHIEKQTPSPEGRAGVRIKICGMNLNTREIAVLHPDYLGFIFWKPSKRSFDGSIPELPANIKKVGVFVDAAVEEILGKIEKFGLHTVQLHGKESPKFCKGLKEELKNTEVKVIKVFSIHNDFDFSILKPYEKVCDYFLFDTKGRLPGGNGYAFDWTMLKYYPSTKPYFLSGGIGLEEVDKIKAFLKSEVSRYCYALDVNSKFELEPGLKDIDKLKEFMNSIE